jgi:ABC-type multidrug transport system fused ATPase/permease subunit
MTDERYALVFAEAQRAVAQQQGSLDTLRSRAGNLISATAIATSFLGGFALAGGSPGFWGWVAVGLFVGVILACLGIFLPLFRWRFENSAEVLLMDIEGPNPPDLAELQRDTAYHMFDDYQQNQKRLDRLYWLFILAGILLMVEIAAWVAGNRRVN